MACKTDPAMEIIETMIEKLTDVFTGVQCPPKVGQVKTVRFFAGDGAPLAAWDSHASQGKGCSTPFVWVRAKIRYRSRDFPAPAIDVNPCGDTTKVLAVEVGCAWCAVVEQEPKWSDYDDEAAKSMDAAWRIEIALRNAACALKEGGDEEGRLVGTDTIIPYGPEGGVIAWTGGLYASYS